MSIVLVPVACLKLATYESVEFEDGETGDKLFPVFWVWTAVPISTAIAVSTTYCTFKVPIGILHQLWMWLIHSEYKMWTAL